MQTGQRGVAAGGGSFTVGLAQCRHPSDGDVVGLVEAFARRARGRADILVFPESLMTPYGLPARDFIEAAQPLDGPFARAVESIAAEHGIWIVYTVNEYREDGRLPYNTAVVADGSGRRRGVYRKVHLFDAQGFRESERMSAGGELCCAVDAPFGRLGLGICYDLRFPEHARAAALAGCDLVLYPAAWVDGERKADQWLTLLAARAVENRVYVAGVCRCDGGYVGNSCAVSPEGEPLCKAGHAEDLLLCGVEGAVLDAARARTPSLDHRRDDLY